MKIFQFILVSAFVVSSSKPTIANELLKGNGTQLISKISELKSNNQWDSVYHYSMKLYNFEIAEYSEIKHSKLFLFLADYHLNQENSDSVHFYYDRYIRDFKKHSDTNNLAIAIFKKGFIHSKENNIDSTIKLYKKAIEIFNTLNDTLWKGISNNYLGMVYFRDGNYVLALKHMQQSLKNLKLLENNLKIGTTYNTLGIIYRKLKEKDREEEAYLEAIKYLEDLGNTIVLGQTLNNLAEIYFDKSETEKAFETLEKSKQIYLEADYPLGLCSYYSVLAYYHSTSIPPNHNKVIEYCNKSIEISWQYEDYRQYADATSYLGTALYKTGKVNQAAAILEDGLSVAKKNRLNPEIAKIKEILATVYFQLNQPSKAYKLLRSYVNLQDSLLNEAKIKEFTQLDLQFKFRQEEIKRNLEMQRIQLEKDFAYSEELRKKENSTLILLFISILLIIIIGFIYFYFRRNKNQVKLLSQKNNEIQRQKAEIEDYARKIDDAFIKLKELDEYKKAMTNMLVHDLKNPLNLLVNIDSFENDYDKNNITINTANQMLNLVLNLLDINKAESSRLHINKTQIKLNGLIEKSINEVSYLSSQKNIKIANKASSDFAINGDENYLIRVFINLLTNALKFSKKDSQIHFKTALLNAEILKVTVKDFGKGIAEKYHEVIFEKYMQAEDDNSGAIKSTGLGLAFCKLAIEAHQWEIGVDSAPDKGSEFWILIKKPFNEIID